MSWPKSTQRGRDSLSYTLTYSPNSSSATYWIENSTDLPRNCSQSRHRGSTCRWKSMTSIAVAVIDQCAFAMPDGGLRSPVGKSSVGDGHRIRFSANKPGRLACHGKVPEVLFAACLNPARDADHNTAPLRPAGGSDRNFEKCTLSLWQWKALQGLSRRDRSASGGWPTRPVAAAPLAILQEALAAQRAGRLDEAWQVRSRDPGGTIQLRCAAHARCRVPAARSAPTGRGTGPAGTGSAER